MSGKLYYYMSALPRLGELGTAPPISFYQMMGLFDDEPECQQNIEPFFLQDDLIQREAFLSAEQTEVRPTILTPEQTRNEAPLPAWLTEYIPMRSHRVQADALWEACFYHAHQVGEQQENEFIKAWVSFEVGLRNALATTRARRLELEPNDYLVAPELAAETSDYHTIIEEWSAVPDPLAGLGVIMQARWAWLDENEAWFTFSKEELSAYAARLVLLELSHRLAEAEQKTGSQRLTGGVSA
jgi:hypothetical protein